MPKIQIIQLFSFSCSRQLNSFISLIQIKHFSEMVYHLLACVFFPCLTKTMATSLHSKVHEIIGFSSILPEHDLLAKTDILKRLLLSIKSFRHTDEKKLSVHQVVKAFTD